MDLYSHTPVLLKQVLDALNPKDNRLYVDATFGGGGYSKAFLSQANCRVLGIDRDEDAHKRARDLAKENNRFLFSHAPFSQMPEILHQHGIEKVDGVVFDLGISSYQIDDPERGFSLRFNGPLSMQMGHNHISAYDVVNSFSEKEIDNILYEGEERNSRRIAHAIIKKRAAGPIQTTKELADLIKSLIPVPKDAQHPATLTFQAIRMFVNNELEEIRQALSYCKDILNPDGRLIVVTFHSLEDRIVKNFFKDITGNAPSPSRYVPLPPQKKVSFKLMTPQPITPTLDEIQRNPRSRSAKLRYIRRLYEFEEK